MTGLPGEFVRVERCGPALMSTFNQPAKLNAFEVTPIPNTSALYRIINSIVDYCA
ncbi:hypothetical protein [Streptomyces sp. AS02]|uniref:hypothetical protein n=1 Tax=Streptomyces sp. AS02 TaxID=2938946 RepID=UPI002020DA0E|nr:hypothetical protein [Streptomyces sp. AS02]MCL8011432.1 hypothetical protein [Streptomyces sp. AS02]